MVKKIFILSGVLFSLSMYAMRQPACGGRGVPVIHVPTSGQRIDVASPTGQECKNLTEQHGDFFEGLGTEMSSGTNTIATDRYSALLPTAVNSREHSMVTSPVEITISLPQGFAPPAALKPLNSPTQSTAIRAITCSKIIAQPDFEGRVMQCGDQEAFDGLCMELLDAGVGIHDAELRNAFLRARFTGLAEKANSSGFNGLKLLAVMKKLREELSSQSGHRSKL